MKGHVGIPVEPMVEEYCTKPVFDEDGVQVSAGIGKDGREYGDPVPMAPPIGYSAPPDLLQMIRSMVRSEELRRAQEAAGVETFDEADDFDIEDDPLDPLTQYEKIFYPEDERKAAPGSVDGGPQAAKTAPSAVQEPVKGTSQAEGAVSSPPPGKEKEA